MALLTLRPLVVPRGLTTGWAGADVAAPELVEGVETGAVGWVVAVLVGPSTGSGTLAVIGCGAAAAGEGLGPVATAAAGVGFGC